METAPQIERGDFLWLDNKNNVGNEVVAIGARVLSVFCDNRMPPGEKRILLMDDDGKKIDVTSAELFRIFNARPMHQSSIQLVEDFLQMCEPHEASIVRNLHLRHRERIHYTFIGQRILLAMRPNGNKMEKHFKQYNALYCSHSTLELPPHIFSFGAQLLQKMDKSNWSEDNNLLARKCCVVFSGECGSGKSENAQYLFNFINENAAGPMMKEQLNAIILLMNAFGNAKTASNLNGSRIGACWQLNFCNKNGKTKLNSANVEHFFMEKGRIVDAAIWPENQRNFHVFYSLIAGLNQRQKLEFGITEQPKNYHFLDRNKSGNISVALPIALCEICNALRTLLFKEAEIDAILRILCAILHFGNLRFEMISIGNGTDARVEVSDRKNIGRICKILKLDETHLIAALTTKMILLKNGEKCSVDIVDVREALDARDGIVRECYGKLVEQIIAKANETVGGGHRKDCNSSGSICLVDFPGIEANFDVENNFEQLCINYALECLQQFFIRRIFKFEQSEYEAQGLPGWTFGSIEFVDNWPILDMLAINSLNIMGVIDDASCSPNSTDDQLLERLHNAQHSNEQRFYLSPKSRLCAQFVICHYTGQVAYRAKGMLARNKNHFPGQLRLLLVESKLPFLRHLFELPAQNGAVGGENEWMSENEETIAHMKQKTLANCCRLKMDALMGRLEQCSDAYFVKCIRPNDSIDDKKHFDRSVVLRQIRQFDLLSVVEQCRNGFTAKFEYSNFVSRYRITVPKLSTNDLQKCNCMQEARSICQRIFEENGKIVPSLAFGKTKIFLKAEAHLMLEQLRKDRFHFCAVLVQKIVRGWAKVRQFERLRWAAIVFQKNWRTFVQQRNYQKIIRGFICLQSLIKGRRCVRRFGQIHANIVQLQALCRAALLRSELYSRPTIEDRRSVMNFRLEEDKKLADEPPALFLHAAEFDAGRECVNNLCGGICVRFKGQMPTEMETKSYPNYGWNGAAEVANFGWSKFVLAYFQHLTMFHHKCRRPIHRPLLAQNCQMDEMCAMAIWCRLQQLMGNAFDLKGHKKGKDQKPIMLRLSAIFSKNWGTSSLAELKSAIMYNSNMNIAHHGEYSQPNLLENILICCGEESALDKIQLIVGIGILRIKLRDEIFCQICTQIDQNASERSKARGWILLTLCSACFSPSAQLLPYFLNFVHRFAPTKQIFCRIERSLMRIRRFGVRKEPPIETELFHSKFDDAQMFVPIHLADGRAIHVPIDSQSTAFELCATLCKQIGLDDPFGFGLFLSVECQHFVRPLGVGAESVIDAIASLEMKNEKNWRLLFRKELFRSRESKSDDPLAIELAYQQIVHGIHTMEYPCEKEDELVTLMAQRHLIDIGGLCEFDAKLLEEKLDEMLPIGTLNIGKNDDEESIEIERQRWVQLIMHTFRKKVVKDGNVPPSVQSAKCQLIEFARIHWPLIFSRFFLLNKFSGPNLPCNQIAMAVNSDGLILFDPPKQNKMAEFTFAQISTVSHSHSKRAVAQSISVQFLNGDRFIFQSPRSAELALLLNQILHHLRHNSLYAIALQNSHAEHAFEFARGDLLILNVPFGQQTSNERTITVENAHNGMHGTVALNAVHILATAEMPTSEELRIFLTPSSQEVEEAFLSTEPTENGIVPFHSALTTTLYDHHQHSSAAFWTFHFDLGQRMRHQQHNLDKFAADNFRRAEAINGFATAAGRITAEDSSIYSFCSSVAADDHNDLWRHSKKPLKAPLLKRLNTGGRDEIVQQSIYSYSHILMYMFDQPNCSFPSHFTPPPLLHSDAIFEAPLKNEILRDETYCQLMKQLTLNPNPISEERGWELMWLCLGLFAPSSGLLPELDLFLRSRPIPMAVDCAGRLEKIINRPFSFRQFPPHQVEVEAIQQRQTQIFHKIHLPNGSQVNVEVESWSVAKDLCRRIAQIIDIQSAFGLFLFVKIGEKVVCIPSEDHFFDFIHQLQQWTRKSGTRRQQNEAGEQPSTATQQKQTAQFAYKVHFMRKVWLDVVPGQDIRQDLIFHYYQELPKYLRGYHNIGKKEVAQIGALILRAQTKDGKQPPLAHIHHILQQLVPKDYLKTHSSAEWKKQISAEFGGEMEMPKSSTDAKMAFLRRMALEPTFGSAFFEVKQSADPKMGSKLLVAINRGGISLYGLESKQHICTYGFEQICHWQPANTYFHITMDKGNRLLFETTLGHKLDDLLTTYIQALIARRDSATKCHENVNAKFENGSFSLQLLTTIGDKREFA